MCPLMNSGYNRQVVTTDWLKCSDYHYVQVVKMGMCGD